MSLSSLIIICLCHFVNSRISLHLVNIVTIVESGCSEGLFVKMVDNEQLTLIEDSLMTDDVSSDIREKTGCYQSAVILFLQKKRRKKTYQM
ncbi:hypothetical protein WA026_016700 [Henosepilachna vigintioctopunctata]|uniref:Uncharacterized protein n=1 Tax=Henosepilachna vigintioctopunctata TaxID=420089 RepID=A0AAW1UV91_9CUCU